VIYIVDPFRIPEDQELEILTMLYGEEAAQTAAAAISIEDPAEVWHTYSLRHQRGCSSSSPL